MAKQIFGFLMLLISLSIISCSDSREIVKDSGIYSDVSIEDAISDTLLDAGTDSFEVVHSCTPATIKNDETLQDKFSLSLFHYNIQYIAGGGEKYENAIIRIGFEPILDILLRHPNWKFTIEMQAYMVEIMAERYPKTFIKLKQLVKNCQVELVSFHYSDQLFLAYPVNDMRWSIELNNDIFSSLGIFPSGVVFTQEGQFGEGMLPFMKENNYNIALYPKNLFRYFQGNIPFKPLYSKYDTDIVVVGGSVNSDGILVDWSYFNDGELLTTGGFSPYFVDTGNYKIDEESIKKYENELAVKEQAGYRITTVGDYVATIKARGIKAEPLPPLLDGTWQPDDTQNIFRWMGDMKGQIERDNYVLTTNYNARKYVLSLETVIGELEKKGIDTDSYKKALKVAKRYLAFAEVSDSTGWYPNKIEVEYSISNANLAKEIALKTIKEGLKSLGINGIGKIDNQAKTITSASTKEEIIIDQDCPLDLPIAEITSEYYSYKTFCKVVDENRTDVRIVFSPTDTTKFKTATLKLKYDTDIVEYIPALMEERGKDAFVSYHASNFAKNELNTSLASGLIRLDSERFLIKHNEYFHISPFMNFETKTITFIDNTPESSGFEWRFSIIKGDSSKAYQYMKDINLYPVVFIE